jgi:hypothetical protein
MDITSEQSSCVMCAWHKCDTVATKVNQKGEYISKTQDNYRVRGIARISWLADIALVLISSLRMTFTPQKQSKTVYSFSGS